MRFTFAASALVAMATSTYAQTPTEGFDPVQAPQRDQAVTAGSVFPIKWDVPPQYQKLTDTVAIHLIGGATQFKQFPIAKIASGIQNSLGSYAWSVNSTLGDAAVYGLKVELESDPSIFQFSSPFKIQRAAASPDTVTVSKAQGVKTAELASTTNSATTAAPSTLKSTANSTTLAPTTSRLTKVAPLSAATGSLPTSTKSTAVMPGTDSGEPVTITSAAVIVGASPLSFLTALMVVVFAL